MLDLDAELLNWRRVVRAHKVRHQCGSIEGMYRPQAENIEFEPTPPRSMPPIRILDGWRVEQVWRSLDHRQYKILLSAHYIHGRPLGVAVRKAKLEHHKSQDHLRDARHLLAQMLDSYDNRVQNAMKFVASERSSEIQSP